MSDVPPADPVHEAFIRAKASSGPPAVAEERAAASPPVGVSSGQIFVIALILLAFYGIAGVGVIWKGSACSRSR